MKKKVKRIVLVLIVVALSVVVGFKLLNDYRLKEKQEKHDERVRQTTKEVENLKINSFLGLDFFAMKNEGRQKRQEPSANEMSDMVDDYITTDDEQVKGTYFIYDGMYRMTQLDLRSADYHVYGIKVTDDIGSAKKMMADHGYEEVNLSEKDEKRQMKEYQKYDLSIIFSVNEEETTVTSIYLSVYNEKEHEGIIY